MCWDYSERTSPDIGFRFGAYSMCSIFYKSTYLFSCIALSISPHTCISPFPLAIVSFRLLSCFSAYVFHPSFLSLQIFHFLLLHHLTEFIVLLFHNFADNRCCFFFALRANCLAYVFNLSMRYEGLRHISAPLAFFGNAEATNPYIKKRSGIALKGSFCFTCMNGDMPFRPNCFHSLKLGSYLC